MKFEAGLSRLAPAFLGLVLAACNSPLLNHENAADQKQAQLAQAPSDCPVSLPKNGLCASWSWETRPTDQEMGTATVRFWKAKETTSAGPYVDPGAEVAIQLWMASMGHGSSPVTVEPRKDTAGKKLIGEYTASEVFFVMPGAWEVRVQLKKGSTLLEQGKLNVTI